MRLSVKFVSALYEPAYLSRDCQLSVFFAKCGLLPTVLYCLHYTVYTRNRQPRVYSLRTMPPLSFSPHCAGCHQLTKKIAKLEGQISCLYQIQEDEQLLDSLAAEAAEASHFPDNNITLPWLGPSGIAKPLQPIAQSSMRMSRTNLSWVLKPKIRICSTPAPSEPWTVIQDNKRQGKNPSRTPLSRSTPPSGTIWLDNIFEVLGKLEQHLFTDNLQPPVGPAQPKTKPHLDLSGASACRLAAADHHTSLQRPPSRTSSSRHSGERQHQPTTLVLGDSSIRNVRAGSAITCLFPGATVHDVTDKAIAILANKPEIISHNPHGEKRYP